MMGFGKRNEKTLTARSWRRSDGGVTARVSCKSFAGLSKSCSYLLHFERTYVIYLFEWHININSIWTSVLYIYDKSIYNMCIIYALCRMIREIVKFNYADALRQGKKQIRLKIIVRQSVVFRKIIAQRSHRSLTLTGMYIGKVYIPQYIVYMVTQSEII